MRIGLDKSRTRLCILGLLAIVLLSELAHAQVPPNPGAPRTPYAPENPSGVNADEPTVFMLKTSAGKARRVYSVLTDDSQDRVTINHVALGYLKGHALNGELFYFFKGANEVGVNERIDFSEVDALTLIRMTGTTALVEIEQFPAISVNELLAVQPSYVELTKRYRRVVRLELPIRDGTGAALYLFDGEEMTPMLAFSRVKKSVRLPFYDVSPVRGPWWATPSVTADSTYPQRRVDLSLAPRAPSPCAAVALAFGSPLAGELRYVRTLRDSYLKPTAIGRLIIDGYYTASAWVVPYIENSPTVRVFTRPILVPIVYVSRSLVGNNESLHQSRRLAR